MSSVALIGLALALVPILSSSHAELFLGGILAALGGLVFFFQPHLGVWTILLILWLGLSPDFLPGRFSQLPYLISPVLMVSLALAAIQEGEVRALKFPQVKLLIGIGALVLFSSWWNLYGPPQLFQEFDKTEWLVGSFISRFVFLILFITFMATPKRIEATIWLLIGTSAIVAFNAWGSIFESGLRAASEFGFATNPNRLAFLSLFAFGFVWFFRTHSHASWKGLTLPLVLAFPATALTSGSRSGLLQMAVLFLLILNDQRGGSLGRQIRALVLLGLAAILILAVVPSSPLQRAMSYETGVYGPGQESLTNRIATVYEAFGVFLQNPIFGIGFGNFETIASPMIYGMGRGVHNSYLRALSEGGITVFALYMMIFVVTFRMLRKLEAHGPAELLWMVKGLRAGMVLFLMFSATADIWHTDYFYLLVGATLGLWQCASVAQPETAPPGTAMARPFATAEA